MPFLARITVRGSGPGVDEADQITEALAAAVRQGWESRWAVIHEDPDDGDVIGDAPQEAPGLSERTVLDHRILGYPGGGFVLVVLGGEGLPFEEAALAAAELGRHITGFSPGLMACSVESIQVSVLDRPYDEENWLPPLSESGDDTRPHFELSEHLDRDLQALCAKYLLAGAVRSLWSPGRRVNAGSWLIAREVVLGAVQHPWGRELTGALGSLLIKAARFEDETGEHSKPVLTAGGSLELATDLLLRARATVVEDSDDWDDWDDDENDYDDDLRGHQLLEGFMEEHGLLWNRVLDDESAAEAEDRGDRQLRELLWAGLSTLATLCVSAKAVTNPWALLAEIDDDPVISVFAGAESAQIEEELQSDAEDLRAAAYACALAWLAARRPDVIEGARGDALLKTVARDVTAFHMVANAQLMEVGPNPIRAALTELNVSEAVRHRLEAFTRALDVTWSDDSDDEERERAYEDMSGALEMALAGDGTAASAVREVVRVFHRAAQLTGTEVNSRRGEDGYVCSAHELSVDMVKNGAMHAALMLSQHDDEGTALRLHTLGLTAWVSPSAAGSLAMDLPDLVGPDPRTEPAARQRSLQWVADARDLAHQQHGEASMLRSAHGGDLPAISHDARALLDSLSEGAVQVGSEWDVRRLAGAAAEAAASLLIAVDAAPAQFAAVFAGPEAMVRGAAAEFLDD